MADSTKYKMDVYLLAENKSVETSYPKLVECLEKTTYCLAVLLRSKLSAPHDLMVLEAQENALYVLDKLKQLPEKVDVKNVAQTNSCS